ncbi:MAG: hypothetical protein SFY69_00445 [Planctomycetota bacterium]|nr:hypothetical protein [Planctomycetota bacterium]
MFTRSGTAWSQQAKLIASDGSTSDRLGSAVALAGDIALVGAASDDIGANSDQGSVRTFDVAANDFPLAHNDVTDISFTSLAAALLPATSGQQITATEAAWRTAGNLDTAGRSLILRSSGDLRTSSTSTLTLGGSSSLNTDSGNVVEINGQLRAQDFVDVYAADFTLGSRGILTARTNSSLTINAPAANLDGQTRAEQGAALTFAGSALAIGPTTLAFGSTLTAGGVFENIDALSITDATVAAPLLFNRSTFNVFGGCAIFGSFTNNAGAVTTIRGETLYVFGSLTNNGTIIGTICSNCRNGDPDLDVTGTLALGPAASLLLPFDQSVVSVGGDFDCAINSNSRYDMHLATLQLEGAAAEQTLEVMSADIGPVAAGLDRTLAGHYPVGTLRIGPAPSTARLVDTHDNDLAGQGSCEALYVDHIIIDAGSRLINTTCRVYYNTASVQGTVDVPANLIQIGVPPTCDPDFNQDGNVDQDDIECLAQVVAGDPSCSPNDPDFNRDGNVDQDDIDVLAQVVAGAPCP